MQSRADKTLQLRLGIAALVAAAFLLPAAPASAADGCHRVASPSGSDSAAGTAAAPFRTAEQLVDSLSSGQTGCLRQGTYGGGGLRIDEPGVTLRSFPGERATVTNFMEVYPEAVGARVSGLSIVSTNNGNGTGVKIQADGAVFSDNILTKGGKGICLLAASYNPARDIVIERNRIYDCGPSDSKYDHQLYLVHTRGAVVRHNVLTGNKGGWGVHLYTDADGTLIERNIIDGNRGGVVFAGDGSETSDSNTVRNNAITFNGPRWNIEGSWSDGPAGRGNSAHDNCVFSTGEDAPSGIATRRGFSAASNAVLSHSPYANRSAGDYRFRSDSPCARLVGNVAGPAVAGAPLAGASRKRAKLSLRSRKRRVRPSNRLVLKGRMSRRRAKGARVSLQIRTRKGWRTVARRRLRRGSRFRAKLRARRVGRGRVVRMRAVVKGIARSRTVRIKVLR